MRNILYSGYYGDSGYPFNSLVKGGEAVTVNYPRDLRDPNSILILWGGADISPSLYNHKVNTRTYAAGQRDYEEWDLVQAAIVKGIPIIGVCRGAQMLCAAAGGYLFQHTTGHHGSHRVETYDGTVFQVNSIHHQMMCVPEGVDHEVLAWTHPSRSNTYQWDGNKEHDVPEKELEFVYFPKIKGYAIQWHPEGMQIQSEATQFILKEFTRHDI